MFEFDSIYSFQRFSEKVRKTSRFIFDQETIKFLETLYNISQSKVEIVSKDSVCWRAQIGNSWEPLKQNGNDLVEIPCPFHADRMKPIEEKACDGRANPKGIPYLYVSNKKETALSEVRPWIGSLISLAQLKIQKNLKIINFSLNNRKTKLYIFKKPNTTQITENIWAEISNAFSKPLDRNDDLAEYAPTQIIAEYFKSKGFDGVAYNSLLENGKNIALFDINSAELINCCLYIVRKVKFKFEEELPTPSVPKFHWTT